MNASHSVAATAAPASPPRRGSHRAPEGLLLERRGRADRGDERGQERQRHLERERARVAEAVRGAEARDRVDEQAAPAGRAQGLERVVALELLVAGGRDGAGRWSRGLILP